MDIKAKDIVLFPTSKLSEYPKNANKHTDEQIDEIIKLIDFYGHRDALVVDADKQPDGTHWVLAGNGRLMAAKKAGWENVPCSIQKFKSDEEKYGFMVSHNAVSSVGWGGGLDLSKINIDISDLGPDFDISFLGIKDFTVEPMEKFELDDEDDAVDLSGGTKKAIMIEFNPEHYEEAYELVKYWRSHDAYVGMMILTFLKQKKDENN